MALMNMLTHKTKITYLYPTPDAERRGILLIKVDRSKKNLMIPPVLENALKKQPKLNTAFNGLTPGKQREYAGHIGDAKREATQISRLQKSIP